MKRGEIADAYWSLEQAQLLIRLIHKVTPRFGCYVALTGGLLYKDGPRKDLDLLFYRIRQVDKIDIDGLFRALMSLCVIRVTQADQWCIKATYGYKKIDCFFPELPLGDGTISGDTRAE